VSWRRAWREKPALAARWPECQSPPNEETTSARAAPPVAFHLRSRPEPACSLQNTYADESGSLPWLSVRGGDLNLCWALQ
jgi:hypothetical protein